MTFLKKYWNSVALAVIAIVFLCLRIPGLNQPYHQDEYKWAKIVAVNSPLAGTIPHPPLSEKTYILADRVFGNAHLRMMPFVLSMVNLFLVYVVVRKRYGKRVAMWAAALFAISYYSILASLMVDTDGQVLPLFFLLGVYAYDQWQEQKEKKKQIIWFVAFLCALALGMLTKFSFVIPVAAFIVDWAWSHRESVSAKTRKKILISIGATLVVGVVGFVAAVHFIPALAATQLVTYTSRFFNIAHRNVFQVMVQALKAVMYASPLLIAPLFVARRDVFAKTRLWWIFLSIALMFYLVIFDFSVGALDRYLQAVVVPLVIMSSVFFTEVFEDGWTLTKKQILLPIVGGLGILALSFLPQVIPPHHPKTDWLIRVATLKWNFLFPFSGGSGPLGLYVSFLVIGVSFVAAVILCILIRKKPLAKKMLVATLLVIGVVYNAVFAEEYLFGKINGYAPVLLQHALAFISADTSIDNVISYNDIGSDELTAMGKSFGRLYIDPQYDQANLKKVNSFSGYYLVIDLPHINQDSMYAKYFSSCTSLYHEVSQRITSDVYDCRKANELKPL